MDVSLRFIRSLPARPGLWPATLLIGLSLGCVAALFTASSGTAADEEPFGFQPTPPTMLVLFDGRIVRGRISEVPGGYRVDNSQLHQVIAYEHVRLAASSLEEAYRTQRDALQKPTASDHMQLARWCVANKLYTQATEQVAAALKLEPNRGEARKLLQEIAAAQPEQVPRPDHGKQSADRPIGELSSMGITLKSQAEFMRRVQPILVNRCGNASCHGSASQNHLKLAYVRTGRRQQRLETENNLSAILAQIDVMHPQQSPLLTVPLDGESQSHRRAFSGRAGKSQVVALREWVHTVAHERRQQMPDQRLWTDERPQGVAQADFTSAKSADDAGPSPVDGPTVEPVSHESAGGEQFESPLLIEIPRNPGGPMAARNPAGPTGIPNSRRGRNSSNERPSQPGTTAFLQEILEQDRPDAFDPDEFNRKVHGRSRTDAVPQPR